MPLWRLKREVLERVAKEIEPDAVEVTLLSGLYASVKLANGEWVSIPEYRFEGKITCKDYHR